MSGCGNGGEALALLQNTQTTKKKKHPKTLSQPPAYLIVSVVLIREVVHALVVSSVAASVVRRCRWVQRRLRLGRAVQLKRVGMARRVAAVWIHTQAQLQELTAWIHSKVYTFFLCHTSFKPQADFQWFPDLFFKKNKKIKSFMTFCAAISDQPSDSKM